MGKRNISQKQPAKAQVSLCICTVLPEPLLFANTVHKSRGNFRQVHPWSWHKYTGKMTCHVILGHFPLTQLMYEGQSINSDNGQIKENL